MILSSSDFKRGKTGFAAWGFDNLYLASSIAAKLKTHNRALVGHCPLACIQRVAVMGTAKSRHGGHLNIVIRVKTQGEEQSRELRLGVHLRRGIDPVEVAQDLLHRSAIQMGRADQNQKYAEKLKAAESAPFPAANETNGWASNGSIHSDQRAVLCSSLS